MTPNPEDKLKALRHAVDHEAQYEGITGRMRNRMDDERRFVDSLLSLLSSAHEVCRAVSAITLWDNDKAETLFPGAKAALARYEERK